MGARLSALRAAVLRAGILGYQYAPLPGHWKDRGVRLGFRAAGWLFRGTRDYELWRLRGSAPALRAPPVPGPRGRVLVVDRYIPQPDRDAGSRSTWCVIRALRRMGFAVTFWPRDLLYDPQYVPLLEAEGVETLWGDALIGRFEEWVAQRGAGFDFAILSRPLVAREFLPSLRRHSRAKVLFYGVDLHFARFEREYALTGQSLLRWEAATMKRIEQSLWKACDVVYYPSSEETAIVRETVPGVAAWTLPLYFFDEPPVAGARPQDRKGILFVAGFGHAPNADAAKWLVSAIMPRVWTSYPDMHLWLVGSNPTADVKAFAGARVTVTGYVSDSELLRFYASARMAIVPLRAGAGMKGKVVEALHHGVPLVTTPVGAQGFDGLPACVTVSEDANVLASRLVTLAESDELWSETSVAQSEYARERFSLQAMEDMLARGMESARASSSQA
jgi:glycosyltransferase involved in cell wall biosynthesis